jgi:hypothetical protein
VLLIERRNQSTKEVVNGVTVATQRPTVLILSEHKIISARTNQLTRIHYDGISVKENKDTCIRHVESPHKRLNATTLNLFARERNRKTLIMTITTTHNFFGII